MQSPGRPFARPSPGRALAREGGAVVRVAKRCEYTNQDCDERQRILIDLGENPRDYLAHPDAQVRSLADWAMEYWGIRSLRGIKPDRTHASLYLCKLRNRLAELED